MSNIDEYSQSVDVVAPFFANLFSYYCENKWTKNMKKKDIRQTRKICKCSQVYWLPH